MEKQFITTSESPKVVLEIKANLRLKGWDELQVLVKTESENNLSIEQLDDAIHVVCASDCKVYVPRQASVTLQVATGDATIKGLEGDLAILEAKGNLTVHGAGPTTIQKVSGDLSVKNIAGDLRITSVYGNATARDVQGDFVVSEVVRGNLTLNDVSGNASAKVNGNATLSLDPAPDEHYDFTAKGNLLCNLPADASAAVHIVHGGHVSGHIPGVDLDETGDEPIDFTLGDGDAELKLAADGNVLISSQAPGWEAMGNFGDEFSQKFEGLGKNFEDLGKNFEGFGEKFSEQFTQQIEAQMEMIEAQIETQLEGLDARLGAIGLPPEQQARVAERARQASDRANERVQEKMRRAQEKLDRKIAEAQRRAEERAREAERRTRVHERHVSNKEHREHRGWHFDWPSPPATPAAPVSPSDPVSDDERMVILRMLEQKKISPEQAEQLLSALEGQGA
jgi:hypothetical protein